MAALKCEGIMHLKDGRVVPIAALTPEELARCKKSMMERMGRAMSLYYAQHPEQYRVFLKLADDGI